MTDKAMTTQQLADYLNVPVRTVEDWRYEDPPGGGDRGPAYRKAGYRHIRYFPADVQRWLRKQQRSA